MLVVISVSCMLAFSSCVCIISASVLTEAMVINDSGTLPEFISVEPIVSGTIGEVAIC